MTGDERHSAVDMLVKARFQPRAVPALSELWPSIRPRDAYVIQDACVARWIEGGRRLVGYKILLSRPDLQRRFHTTEPAFGQLLDDAVLPNGSTVEVASVVDGQAEPEVAVVMGDDLSGQDFSLEDVRGAIAYVTAAIEVPTGHMKWALKFANVVADNGGAGYAVVGNSRVIVSRPTLAGLGVSLRKNGQEVGHGTTDAVLGDPLEAIAWLARKLHSMGRRLNSGALIMTGSAVPSVGIEPGDDIEVEVQELGSATVRFA